MAKTMNIAQDTFEELVGKSSKYDSFFNAGYSDVRVVSRKINDLERELEQMREERNDYRHEVLDLRQLRDDYENQIEDLKKQIEDAGSVEYQVPQEDTSGHIPQDQQKPKVSLNKTLGGYKTYIVAGLGVVMTGLYSQGVIDQEIFLMIEGIVVSLGLGTLRAGVKKAEKQGK